MGHRITSRSRPRSDLPFPFRVGYVETTDIPTPTLNSTAEGAVGPFDLQGAVEFIYRVKAFTVSGTMSVDMGAGPESLTPPGPGTPEDPPAVSELDVFSLSISDKYPYHLFAIADVPLDVGTTGYVSKDENGAFWVWFTEYSFTAYKDAEGGNVIIGVIGANDGAAGIIANVDVVLKSGTYPVQFAVGRMDATGDWEVISADLTLTATEWFPFATTAAAAAFNTTTGAPANGGPGA